MKFYFALQHCVHSQLLLTGAINSILELFMIPKQATNQVIVRKYANRRLYDTNTSRYVTISDLTVMAKNGVDFCVVDVSSGKDLTRITLVQIILEIESKGHQLLPITVLQQLIRFYDDRMEPILSRYLERTMDAFLNHKDHAEEALGASLDSIRDSADTKNDDHVALIRTEFNQLKAKVDRLG